MHFHSHFSDDSAQNAVTTFQNMKNFIHCMYKNNLFIKDNVIYDTIYGCINIYICANSMWLLYVLEFTNRGIIDIFSNATGCVRIKIYGIIRDNKTYLKQIFMIGTK